MGQQKQYPSKARQKMNQDRFVDGELLNVPSGRWADREFERVGGRGAPAKPCDIRACEDE